MDERKVKKMHGDCKVLGVEEHEIIKRRLVEEMIQEDSDYLFSPQIQIGTS